MNSNPQTTAEHAVSAPLWRRLFAIVYDLLVLVCLIFIAWQPMPFLIQETWPEWFSQVVRRSYLGFLVFGFFGWFWTHGGQTIGMRAWKILLVDAAGGDFGEAAVRRVTWGQALKRFLAAILSLVPFGLGFIWSLFDRDNRAWHDRLSGTVLVQVK